MDHSGGMENLLKHHHYLIMELILIIQKIFLIGLINTGQVLGQKQVYTKGREGSYIIERPKVVWNEKTKLFVMWFYLDSNNYGYRYVGIGTPSYPNETFTFIDVFQPDGVPSLHMNLYEDKKEWNG